MIHRVGMTADALPWVERLIVAEPGNPAGRYWKAQILGGTEKPEVALDALRAATGTKGKPDTHLRDRIATVREAALASGATVKEAAILALSAMGRTGKRWRQGSAKWKPSGPKQRRGGNPPIPQTHGLTI